MNQLYKKSEEWFSILFIIIYVVGVSLADQVSKSLGVEKSITLIFFLVLFAVIYMFIKKNDLFAYYGLCKPELPAKKLLYYLPLFILASTNLWFGVKMNLSIFETILYILSMVFVGFFEEIIFRGFLFKALCKDNIKTAIIVSSITFGIGHIVNIFNSSGAEIIPNICQILYATSIGFLFVIMFYHGKSLWPCIITHSVTNSLVVFQNKTLVSEYLIPVSIAIIIISCGYSLFIIKKVPKTSLS